MYASKFHRNENLLSAEDTLLLVVDVQEKFRGVISGFDDVIAGTRVLMQCAARLGIPVMASEQYPKGLGQTVSELNSIEGLNLVSMPKVCFSAAAAEDIFEKIKETGKKHIVITGVEAHVCVLQTALDLVQNSDGWVFVVADAVSSRKEIDRDFALKRMEDNGVRLITKEMAVFEWIREAGTEDFKALQKMIL